MLRRQNRKTPIDVADLKPSILFHIMRSLDVSGEWQKFGQLIGLSVSDLQLYELRAGTQGPSKLMFQHWFAKCPSVKMLTHILMRLNRLEDLKMLREQLEEDDVNEVDRFIAGRLIDRIDPSIINQAQAEIGRGIPQTQNRPPQNPVSPPLPVLPVTSRLPENIMRGADHPQVQSEPPVSENNSSPGTSRNISPKPEPQESSQQSPSPEFRDPIPEEQVATLLRNSSICEFQLDKITHSDSAVLEKGRFSEVYWTPIRGNVMAIKRIFNYIDETVRMKHLLSEVKGLLRFRHPRILTLSGFALDMKRSDKGPCLYLIYPFVEMGSLYTQLHGQSEWILSVTQRLDILINVTEGLAYIHEDEPHKGFHGDVCSRNILLNKHYEACLCDLGASGHELPDENPETRLERASQGYLCTEGIPSSGGDVYSFGVLLLEVWLNKKVGDLTHSIYKLQSGQKFDFPWPTYMNWPCSDFHDSIIRLVEECIDKKVKNRLTMIEIRKRVASLLKEIPADQLSPNYPPPSYHDLNSGTNYQDVMETKNGL